MSTQLERYQKLGLREALPKIYRYAIASKELSYILREAYHQFPKNLQFIIFQDTLTAFRLLPEIRTQSAVSAVHLLLQSVEAALPKQKRNMAVTEFKHAMVAHKRRCKTHQYAVLYGSAAKQQPMRLVEDRNNNRLLQEPIDSRSITDWKEAVKGAYTGALSKKLTTNRGYCGHCKTVVWLNNSKCPNVHCGMTSEIQDIKPVTALQVVEYLLDDSLSITSSSDSDTDSEGGPVSRLWAYPKHIRKY